MNRFPFLLPLIIALILLWMSVPVWLNFSPAQAARWGGLADAPEILTEWIRERQRWGCTSVTYEDGGRTTTFTRDGEIVRVEAYPGTD